VAAVFWILRALFSVPSLLELATSLPFCTSLCNAVVSRMQQEDVVCQIGMLNSSVLAHTHTHRAGIA
jgi:hypothetical protein